jgi:DNA-binding NarL/FixJ family response regulator
MTSAVAIENTLATMKIVPSDIHVLIVDDNQFDRVRIRRMFENTGVAFELSEVDGIDGLAGNLDRKEFDIVLIDFQLPQGDGIEVLKRIQEHELNHDAVTVMIAGDDQSQVAVRAMKNGCKDYIAKGILNAHRLRTLVLSVIEGTESYPAKANRLHERLELLISRVKDHHSSELQPKITKIIEDLRSLRARVYLPNSPLAHELASVEKRCLNLWTSVLETEEIAFNSSEPTKPN